MFARMRVHVPVRVEAYRLDVNGSPRGWEFQKLSGLVQITRSCNVPFLKPKNR